MLAVRLPENLENELSRFSQNTHQTKTDVVKEALKLFFKTQADKKQQTAYELGEALFGRYESGRDDLSSSYKQKLKSKLHDKYNTHR
jgi:predicted DNA-binding protein